MPSREEVLAALRRLGAELLAEEFERVADFVERAAKETNGKVLGFAVVVFPGALVLDAFLDGALALGRDAKLVVRATGRERGIRVELGSAALEARYADCASLERFEERGKIYVCTEESRELVPYGAEPLRRFSTVVLAGRALYIVARPTWNVLHLLICSPEHARRLIESHGISVPR